MELVGSSGREMVDGVLQLSRNPSRRTDLCAFRYGQAPLVMCLEIVFTRENFVPHKGHGHFSFSLPLVTGVNSPSITILDVVGVYILPLIFFGFLQSTVRRCRCIASYHVFRSERFRKSNNPFRIDTIHLANVETPVSLRLTRKACGFPTHTFSLYASSSAAEKRGHHYSHLPHCLLGFKGCHNFLLPLAMDVVKVHP